MNPLRIGPLLLCLAVGVARAVWLASQIAGVTASALGYLLLADLPVLGLLGLLLALESMLSRGWRLLALLAAIGLTALYLVDVAAVVALNARLQFDDLTRFGVEWWLLPSYVNGQSILGFAGVIGAFLIAIRLRPARVRMVGTAAIVVWLTPLLVQQRAIPPYLHKYTTPVLGMGREFIGLVRQPMPRYTVGDYDVYREGYDGLLRVPFTASRRNVVLVIVESLSAADSARTSGLGHLLGRFDALSERGMLFTNFLANFEASEGGIVSLLSGVPPMHFPTASTDTFAEYALQPAVTAQLADAGYRCEFLTSVPLRFISMDRYLKSASVGFHFAGGQQEIARYRDAPRYAFQSPTDHLLYRGDPRSRRHRRGPSPAAGVPCRCHGQQSSAVCRSAGPRQYRAAGVGLRAGRTVVALRAVAGARFLRGQPAHHHRRSPQDAAGERAGAGALRR